MLKRYHILPDKVNDFYSQQDMWDIAKHPVNGETDTLKEIDPFYNMIKLPGGLGDKAELVLMRPFTPFGAQKHNMVSWLSVRNSSDHYGEMILFNFPKNKNILGPNQIEIKINQIEEISTAMTLWGQSGSEVYKGNLLVIPIENSVLYVEPIYVKAKNESATPEVKKIIVGYQSQDEFMYGIGDNLDSALASLFSGQPAAVQPENAAGESITKNNASKTGTTSGAAVGMDQKRIDQIKSKYNEMKKQLDELGQMIQELQ
jgi:uncharacterized membrane protein (UPF0182 family)